MALPDDIITKVRQDFTEDDSLLVLQRLKELVEEDAKLFSDRILRCLVFLSGGNINKLVRAVETARLDWRDVISAAECDWGNQVRLLSLPFGIYPDLKIFKQWFVGQEILIPWADNQKWTVEYSDIRSFSLEQVRQLSEVNKTISDSSLYFSLLSFLCIRGEREISASKAMEGKIIICYRINPVTNGFEFQKFSYNPKDIGKRGAW